jgi:hypothetical protein
MNSLYNYLIENGMIIDDFFRDVQEETIPRGLDSHGLSNSRTNYLYGEVKYLNRICCQVISYLSGDIYYRPI